ncbi:hypothetical protein MUN81_04465 [Hymenobacter sp. 5317J-9]|uniref:hypothetical protein n=1 Tax=Hymenobacter sp. 5317J-9 TaxID=2932250 RepID=UPI001FD6DAF6|nr:hypothetical protein [Hymenobacter sp. 5317J-9]UOQ98748.1 hypothetical protein MUN81_04465 [Hymenobacter sp. 5317J-9]
MKLSVIALLAGLVLAAGAVTAPVRAQSQPDLGDIGLQIYQRANSPGALERMRKDLINAPEAYLVSVEQPGVLVLPNKRRIRVPAMRYNVALHLLEARDSTGSHVWPPGSLDGFYLGQGADVRHFRTFVVRNGNTQRDFVEVLTRDDDAFLILAVLHHYVHEDAQYDPVLNTVSRPARTEIGQVVVAGSGVKPQEPLRAVSLNQREIPRLFGTRAAQVEAYAAKEHLSYTDLGQVLRMVEYYNLQGK